METQSSEDQLLAIVSPTDLAYNDFAKFDIRAGTIKSIEVVPKSKKLLKLEVSFGPSVGDRVIVAGLASIYEPPGNVGGIIVWQKVVAVLNLAPRDLFGITSHGMVLACHDENGRPWLLNPGTVSDGERIG
jgi:methionyl-tRNA synthetase